ncbi:MAG: hypothetical protein J5687_01845 [Treponema sp.]|nr:hypothetical protein [Treponema sp.]
MILYDIPSVAQITVNFSCFASQKKKDADMVKVTAAVTNTRADDPPKLLVVIPILTPSPPLLPWTY